MALLFASQKQMVPPTTLGPGVRFAIAVLSVNASVSSFTVASPFSSLVEVRAKSVGDADTTRAGLIVANTMNSAGYIGLGTGNTVTFTKNSSTQGDYIIEFIGT